VWFRTQAAISAATANGDYYLYYGNPSSGAPPADGNNIFDLYDDFNGGSLDTGKWTPAAPSGTSVAQSGGELVISGTTGASSSGTPLGISTIGTYTGNWLAESSGVLGLVTMVG
jgi:hypothetical protein